MGKRAAMLGSGIAAVAALAATVASAQTRQDEQLWLAFAAQGRIDDRTIWVADLQPRFANGAADLSVLLGRIGIGYRVTDGVTVYQGFVHQELLDGGRNEERPYQQIDFDLGDGGWGSLRARIRLEERWFSNGRQMGMRLREQFRFEKPLATDTDALVAVATVEALANLRTTDYGARRGFDSARLFGGLRLPLAGQAVEAGYLAQVTAPPGGATRVDHILLVTLRLTP